MNEFIKQACPDLRDPADFFRKHKTGLQTRFLLFMFLLLFTSPAITRAEETAAEPIEKIFINADYMHMNITTGKSVYTGNVKISQGELVLMGNKVTLERSNEEVERLTVTGKPARYNQVTETGDPIKAQSEHMVYIASQNKLIMTINAHLQQPNLELSSQKIIYDTQKKIVIAGGNSDTTSSNTETKQTQRVNITLTPKQSPADQ